MSSVSLVAAGVVASTTSGEVIIVIRQHARHGKNESIHSSPQIERFKNKVDDRSIKVGGSQNTTTLDDHKFPMSIRNASTHMTLRPCTDREWEKLPRSILTSEKRLGSNGS